MPFTRQQQSVFRPLVSAAWTRTCAQNGREPKDRIARDQWYRAQLHRLAGIYTTRQASHRTDFLPLMAGFEQLAELGIYWQARSDDDRLRRVRWALDQIMKEHDVDQDYVAGIAFQMHGTRDLEKLNADQMLAIIVALKKEMGVSYRHRKAA